MASVGGGHGHGWGCQDEKGGRWDPPDLGDRGRKVLLNVFFD